MFVSQLSVVDFRSWVSVEVAFEPGVSVLIGANGQGKTNLVEAIAYAATLSSHRTASDVPLVRAGADRAVVRTAVVAAGRELRVELEISPGKANRARLNGAAQARPRDVLGAVRTVLFAPEDLAIVRGDPAERRQFVDTLLTTRTPRLAGVRADYDRVLKQRTALLKTAGAARRAGRVVELRTLDVWDEQLADYGGQLLAARLELLGALRPHASAAYAQVAPASAALRIGYQSGVPAAADALLLGTESPPSAPDPGPLSAALLAALAAGRDAEIERGLNLVGPHRDDILLELGELPVRSYASHGESWSVALALRLASYELLRADSAPGTEPVLILDDVFAELDTARRDQLAAVALSAEQAIVTAAVADDVPATVGGARYWVQGGVVERAE